MAQKALNNYNTSKKLICYEGSIATLRQFCREYQLSYHEFDSLKEVLVYEVENEIDITILFMTSDDPNILISLNDTEIPWT